MLSLDRGLLDGAVLGPVAVPHAEEATSSRKSADRNSGPRSVPRSTGKVPARSSQRAEATRTCECVKSTAGSKSRIVGRHERTMGEPSSSTQSASMLSARMREKSAP